MNRIFANTRVALLCLFFLATAGAVGYQAWLVWPMQKCERQGAWWSAKYHQCATPIPIWRITGRDPPAGAAPAIAAP